MKIPFKQLKEAAHEVAETIGFSLDKTFVVSGLHYGFQEFVFTLSETGLSDGIKLKLTIDGDNLERFFRDLP